MKSTLIALIASAAALLAAPAIVHAEAKTAETSGPAKAGYDRPATRTRPRARRETPR